MNKCFSFFFVCFWFTSRSLKWSFFNYSSQFCTCWGECSFLSFHATIPETSPLDTEYRFQILFVSVFDNRSRFFNILIRFCKGSVQFSSVTQSCTTLCNPWITAHQASLSIINSWSSPKLMCIESVMPSSHLILCCPLFLLPPIPPSTRVFSYESALHMMWPKYWSFSFSISPSNEYPGLISFRMNWLDLLAVQGILKSLLQHHSSKALILLC